MDDERLTPRKQQILRAIVDAHIAGGEPVGSKFLSQDDRFGCSSATIRNEMADLEEMGYLVQPHTSAGRIPSELGYRYYVDSLVRQYVETRSEIDDINEKLRFKLTKMDEILEEVSRLASAFTDYTGIAFKSGSGNVRIDRFETFPVSGRDFLLVMMFGKDVVKTRTIHLSFSITDADLRRFTDAANLYLVNLTSEEITMPIIVKLEALMGSAAAMVHPTVKAIYETMSEVDTADVHVDNVRNLLRYPEYSDVDKLRDLLGVIEEKGKLLDVIGKRTTENEDGLHVFIGAENGTDAMSETALIYKNITIGGKTISVGVIGPRRMNYSKVIGMIDSLANGIDRLFHEQTSLPDPFSGDENF